MVYVVDQLPAASRTATQRVLFPSVGARAQDQVQLVVPVACFQTPPVVMVVGVSAAWELAAASTIVQTWDTPEPAPSEAVPLTANGDAPVHSPAVGDVTAAVAGVVSTSTLRATVVVFPATSVAMNTKE